MKRKYESLIIHGHCEERIYHIWSHMKSRCYNPRNKKYYLYGGRGITVCDEWRNDFKAFYDWAMSNGYADNLTIDRKDVNGNYEPSNCRWADKKTQNNNTRQNSFIEYNGKTQTIAQWADEYKIDYSALWSRLDRGWSIEKALTQAENPKHCYIEYDGKRQTIAEWAREYDIPYDKLKQRINKLHWTIEKALTTK